MDPFTVLSSPASATYLNLGMPPSRSYRT